VKLVCIRHMSCWTIHYFRILNLVALFLVCLVNLVISLLFQIVGVQKYGSGMACDDIVHSQIHENFASLPLGK
jgi:hypothetical protein